MKGALFGAVTLLVGVGAAAAIFTSPIQILLSLAAPGPAWKWLIAFIEAPWRIVADNFEIMLAILSAVLSAASLPMATPPLWRRWMLVAATAALLCLSIAKVNSDNKDKELLQDLSISNLALPNDRFVELKKKLDVVFKGRVGVTCLQWSVGISCKLPGQERYLVLNRYEVASIYAKIKRGKGEEATNELRELEIKEYATKKQQELERHACAEEKAQKQQQSQLQQPPNPLPLVANDQQLNDDLMDKLGILGFLAYVDRCTKAPAYYTYHRQLGVNLVTGKDTLIELLDKCEVAEIDRSNAASAFGKFNAKIVNLIKQKGCDQ